MTGQVIAQYTDDDRNVCVIEPRRGADYELVLESSDGLETVIEFDEIDVGRNSLTFRRSIANRQIETASIEAHLEAWGGVGTWIRSHAVTSPQGVA